MRELRVRKVDSAEDFADPAVDPPDDTAQIAEMLESGETQLSWCFVAEEAGRRLGRLGLRVEPTTTDPAWLGSLPALEMSMFGLDLPWEGDFLEVGGLLLAEARRSTEGTVPNSVDARILRQLHEHEEKRRAVFEAWGLDLFQEKQGFQWRSSGEGITVPARLSFTSIDLCGRDRYAAAMARCGEGTLDRNDRYYWGGTGPENWAAQMLEFLNPGDEPLWLLAESDGDPVGFVAVSRAEDWGSTITHVGVVPEHRGRGYINDLLLAGTAAAQAAGIDGMLSDVDVLNQPMMEAMRRNGHPDLDSWHVWHYRGPF
jgi:ribosomal protein S18 acetylase RimI-like enzyme